MFPLVYLDAGTINRIADGDCAPESVAVLHAAMRETNATLVLSVAHIWDFCNGATEDTKARAARAIDAFPRRALVVDGPERTERAALDQQGDGKAFPLTSRVVPIWSPRMFPLVDFAREVFADVALMKHVSKFVNVASAFTHTTHLDAKNRRERRDAKHTKPSQAREHRELTERVLTALFQVENAEQLRGVRTELLSHLPPAKREEAEALLAPHFEAHAAKLIDGGGVVRSRGLTPERGAQLTARQPSLTSVGYAGGGIRGGMERWYEVASAVAPGIALQVRLVDGNTSNVGREPTASDLADRLHMQYVPYMDVSTVDANNFASIKGLLPRLRCPRRGLVLSDPGPDLSPISRALQ